MKFIQLFVSISCASAAVLPVLRRHSAVKFNQLMYQNGSDDAVNPPNYQLPLQFPAMPHFPNLAPLGRILPISFCDGPDKDSSKKCHMDPAAKMALKERLLVHKKLFPIPKPLDDYEPSKNPRFNPKGFERLLKEEQYYTYIAEAIDSGSIDLAYIPSDPNLLVRFSKLYPRQVQEAIKKYFEVGTFEKLRQAGLMTNKDLVNMSMRAIDASNYVLANLIFDHIVAAMLKDIDSDDFNEADWQIDEWSLHYLYGMGEWIPSKSVLTYGLIPLTAEQEEFVKFFVRYNAIFVDAPLRRWKLGSSSCPFINWI